jgi:hypothetical protein
MTMRMPLAWIVFSLVASSSAAQWIELPTPGIPRTKDGKPNLTAPAPRTRDGKPDLSGVWERSNDHYYNNAAADLKPADVKPWAQALFQRRLADHAVDSMETQCLPLGPAALTDSDPVKFIQTPSLIVILLEDLTYRQIHMDGRKLPNDPNPSWMGYSVGRWEGDTLVVESSGFTERVWLDYDGHPHTEALRVTERYRRKNFGHLDVEVTFDDPGAYAKPWTISVPMELYPDTELLEEVCLENEKFLTRTPVKTGSEGAAAVKVPPALLSKYVGKYEIKDEDGEVSSAVVSLSGDTLFLDLDHVGPVHLLPMSDTTFSESGNVIQFLPDGQGTVTAFLIKTIEYERRAVRVR